MPQLFTNNASTALATGISNTATSLTVTSGTGALFPAVTAGSGNYFYITIYNIVSSTETNIEILKVTARSADTFTVVRGQEGTTAQTYVSGAKIELRLTAEGINTIDAQEVLSSGNVTAGGTVSGTTVAAGTGGISSTGAASFAGATFSGVVTASGQVNANAGLSASQVTTSALSTLHSVAVTNAATFNGATTINSAFVLTGDQVQISEGGTGASTAAAARTNLDVYSKTEADDRFINNTDATLTLTNNLSVTGAAGISTTALSSSGTFALTGDQVQVSEGGTGASTAAAARTNLGTVADTTANGIAVRTAANTLTARTLNAGSGISLTNSDGVAGNPIITNTGVLALTSSDGLSSNNSATGSVSVTNTDKGSTQSIFKNIANSAGTTQFSATTNTDSLRFAGTGNTTVAFDTTNKQVTISSADQFVGTVTSVAATGANGISITGSPITSSGTLAVTSNATSANTAGTIVLRDASTSGFSVGPITTTDVSTGTLTATGFVNLSEHGYKYRVRAATTGNITLSATQTVDGVALAVGDRVLVKNQTTAADNGIYDVAAAAWTRSLDANTAGELAGAAVTVREGTTNGGSQFMTTFKGTDTLGTTAMTWLQDAYNGAPASFTTLTASGAATLTGTGNQISISGTGSTFSASPASIGALNNTAIGSNTAASGAFTTLAASGAATLTGTGNQLAVSGTGSTFSVSPATAGSLNNVAIGGTTASTGAFTTLSSTGTTSLAATTATSLNSTPIGATTASTGRFTTVESTAATGTAPLIIASTTRVANLNVATAGASDTVTQTVNSSASTYYPLLSSATTSGTRTPLFSTLVGINPSTGLFTGTTASFSGQLTSTVATGTAPFVVNSTTRVANLNAATAGTADTATNQSGGTVNATSITGNTISVSGSSSLAGRAVSDAVGANTIVTRDGNNYSFFNYINSNTGNSENPSVSQVIVTNGGDGFFRKASIGHLTASLSGTANININGSVTFSDGITQTTSAGTLPQKTVTASTTLSLADHGAHIFMPTGTAALTVTIPANASVAFPIGSSISFVNYATALMTISVETDTLRFAANGATGNRTLAQYGVATAIKVTSTEWIISGAGVA